MGDTITHRGMFNIWLLCAVPWFLAVAFLPIYDHHRAIARSVDAYLAEHGAIVNDVDTARTHPPLLAAAKIEAKVAGVALSAFAWSRASAVYSAPAVAFYGLLPAGVTFFLFVAFLPWALRWSAAGSLEEESDAGI